VIVLDSVARHVAEFPQRVAVADDERLLTWRELYAEVDALCGWLTVALNPSAENRVVAFAGNTSRLVVATAACASLGIPWVGVDPARDRDTVLEQVQAVQPTMLLIDMDLPNALAVVEAAGESGALVVNLSGDSFRSAVGYTGPTREWRKQPFLALGFTSGSTGTPKLFLRRSKSENQRLAYLRDHFEFGPGDVYLATSPMAHASGHVWVNAALTLGAKVVLGSFDPVRMVELVAEHRVGAAFFVPPVLDEFLAAAQDRPDLDLSSLRAVLTGGRQTSARAIRTAKRRLGDVLHVYYATTETGINTFACPAQLAASPRTTGLPMPGVRLLIVDPDTRHDRPAGQVGLIAITSPLIMDNYASGNADFVVRGTERFVLTSDYGHLTAEGELIIVGRSDSLPGDGTVDFVALESELKDLPGVLDAAVVRKPAGDAAEVVAVVRLSTEDTGTVEARLGELLGTQRHSVLVVPRIPYNTAGKVDVRAMRSLLAETPAFA
jgi:acyl-coenzyme A synthetase/AMP-(fatty) acid ligase